MTESKKYIKLSQEFDAIKFIRNLCQQADWLSLCDAVIFYEEQHLIENSQPLLNLVFNLHENYLLLDKEIPVDILLAIQSGVETRYKRKNNQLYHFKTQNNIK